MKKAKSFDKLSAPELVAFIEANQLQLLKTREEWTVQMPVGESDHGEVSLAPVAYGENACEAIQNAYKYLSKSK